MAPSDSRSVNRCGHGHSACKFPINVTVPSRVAVGIQARIPEGIWLTLMAITILGMIGVGYQAGIAGSKRTLTMPLLAIAFASVIATIAALDRPIGGFTVSQQPLIDLLSSMQTISDREKVGTP